MMAPTCTLSVAAKVHTVVAAPLVVFTRRRLEVWVKDSPAPFAPVTASKLPAQSKDRAAGGMAHAAGPLP